MSLFYTHLSVFFDQFAYFWFWFFVAQTAKTDLNRDFLFQYRFTIIFRKKDRSAESELFRYLVLPLQVPNFQDLSFHSFILFTLLLRIHL